MSYGIEDSLITMRKLLLILIIIITLFFILNVGVPTRKGINYQVQILKIPLYLKLLDFFDRHYNYAQLVKSITIGADTQEEKAMKIFEWTSKNISKAPAGLPIIDDHVWNIIIRGYGVDDQFQDVFSTLCNYSHINAFFSYLSKEEGKKPFSFVRFNNSGWAVFDAYNGVYFRNSKGKIASIDDLESGDWQAVYINNGGGKLDYPGYFKNLASVNFEANGLSRPSMQSPLKRLTYFLRNGK